MISHRHTVLTAVLLWTSIFVPAGAQAPPTPTPSQRPSSQSNALALAIIEAWQASSRGATPEARAAQIEKALSLALPAEPWPFREPGRDELLGRMWGQLGNELRRVTGPGRLAALERALDAYGRALAHARAGQRDWAQVQYGLGQVLIERQQGNRADNVEQAIAAFAHAATVITKETAPALWADIQIGLSKAHWHRVLGTRTQNLEQALAYAEAALSAIDAQRATHDRSAALQALGAAWFGRIAGSRADNIEKSIAAWEEALAVTSKDRWPVAWAGLQDNLAMAYAERVRGDHDANVLQAARLFERAAEVFTRAAHPAEWAQLNMNWGNLLQEELPGDRVAHLEAAISHYHNALEVYTRQDFPERWARVHLNLGQAWRLRIKGERAHNMEQAIAAYRNALVYYAPGTDPTKWALAQDGLGFAVRHLPTGNRTENLAAAAQAHARALEVHTPASPLRHMISRHQAGQVAAEQGDWAAAMAHYSGAILAAEHLLAEGSARPEVVDIVQHMGNLHANAAFAAYRLGDAATALDLLEAGKGRLLRTSLGLDALDLPSEIRAALDRERNSVHELEARTEKLAGNEKAATLTALENARTNIKRIIAAQRPRHGPEPGRKLVRRLLEEAGFELVALPVVTERGAVLLMATRGMDGPRIEAEPLPGVDSATLTRYLSGADPTGALGGWLGAYGINHLPPAEQEPRREQWLAAIAGLRNDLGRLVGHAIGAQLVKHGIASHARVLWLPQGGLGLWPIALAGDGSAGGATLLDRATLITAPSLVAALAAHDRIRATSGAPSLAAIVNPTGDLASAAVEGAAVQSFFTADRRRVLVGNSADKASVINSLSRSSYWHFATHGTFSWARPRTSALLLAGSQRLTIADLVDRAAVGSARLVVLSACETGVFDFQRAPDELTGLPTAFLEAGAAAIIGSLWPVDDASTALLMMRFYDRHLVAGQAPPEALRAAQIWLRDATVEELRTFVTAVVDAGRLPAASGAALLQQLPSSLRSRPFAHPYHWAAFQLHGG